MVSADWRYGLVYNLGMAKLLLRHLVQHGYHPKSRVPIVLIGYSGGGQVAAGAAPLLQEVVASPVSVISLAGVMCGSTKFTSVASWHHLISNRDPVKKIGAVFFPLRWRLLWFSSWNRAKRRGVVRIVRLDGAQHDGRGGYLDRHTDAPEGQPLLTRTVTTTESLLKRGD